jgi:hypothetical protein
MGVPYGKDFKSSFTFKETLEFVFDVEIVVSSFYSGYDPYPTQNHDSPRFSDPGSGPEAEYKVFGLVKDSKRKVIKRIDITDLLSEQDLDAINEKIYEQAMENERSAYEAAMEAEYDRRKDEGLL